MSVFVARRCLYVLLEDYELIVGPWFLRIAGPKTIGSGEYRRWTIGRPAEGT